MKYRALKRAKIQLSEVSFGCMSLGDDHSENSRLIRSAYDGGINYFDTADIYQNGFNEVSVGRAVKPFRKEVYLATKVGNEPNKDGSGWHWNPSKSYILKAVDRSLQRLDTDYIDNYQLHGGTIADDREEVIEAFEELVKEGKILNYGISSIRPNVIRAYANEYPIVSNMIQYSLLDRRPEEEAIDVLERNDVGLIVRGALAKGLLAQKNSSDYLNYTAQDIEKMRDKMNSFSIEKMTNVHVAMKWVLAHSAVTTVVVGIRTHEQLKDVLSIHHTPALSQDLIGDLSSVLKVNYYEKHR